MHCSMSGLRVCLEPLPKVAFVRQRRREEEEQRNQAIARFIGGAGQASMTRFTRHVPDLPPVVPVPSRSMPVLSLQLPSDRPSALAAWTVGQSSSTPVGLLSKALETDWDAKHQMVFAADCEAIPEDTDKETLCSQVGRCLCDPAGKQLRAFRERVVAALKAHCPFKSTERTRLQDGEYFLVLRGSQRPPVADEMGGDEFALHTCARVVVLHIAVQYLSPFRSTFQVMCVEGVGGVWTLSATSRFLCEYDAFGMLDLELSWAAQLLELKQTAVPLGQLDPKRVWAWAPTAGFLANEEQLWPFRRRSIVRRVRPRPGADAHDEAGSDPEGDGDAPDDGWGPAEDLPATADAPEQEREVAVGATSLLF